MEEFDVIVIGAGHAGVEAAAAAARVGARVLLTTIDLNSVSFMACNPSIGGVGKSHLVYEIDALDGLMGRIADKTCIQMRTLNASNGPAVRALRAQIDKHDYHATMLGEIESYPNVTLKECEVVDIITDNNKIKSIKLSNNEIINCKCVVVATGVYLNSRILIGHTSTDRGPAGFARAEHLTNSLVNLGITIQRFKTGTPPRVTAQSIDYAATTPQPPDADGHFSVLTTAPTRNLVSCHLTYTNAVTHQIIRDNLQKSAMYSGLIKGVGARYCPSIEDKIVRFASAERHQIFLEPESLSTDEVYLQGISTSLPADVQKQFVQSIAGLEHANIVRNAYAIEYDCIDSRQLNNTLECKFIVGLFFAGQVNGTSGYEEAAAQGLLAGANAGLSAVGLEAPPRPPRLVLSRTNSYIGVLVDDLVTVGTKEPYRMFTSRCEYRLHLRQDNADQRLTPIGRELGLVGDERWTAYNEKLAQIERARAGDDTAPAAIREIVDIERKYAGYLGRETARIAEVRRHEDTAFPADINYDEIKGLRRESQIKLAAQRPQNLAQAMRISGVTPADINILLVWLRRKR